MQEEPWKMEMKKEGRREECGEKRKEEGGDRSRAGG